MPANSKESVILQGYAKTGVTSPTQQSIILQGYHSGKEPPVSGVGIDIVYCHRGNKAGVSVIRR